jgi:septal ring factor EnvC (AmiA/AmiB activator)
MFKCNKCNKEFKFQSDLIKHQNRKTPCNKEKIDLKCNLCNVNFKWPAEKVRHEKTKKHLDNIHIENNHFQDNIISNETKFNELTDKFNKILNENKNLINENKNLTNKIDKLLLEHNLLKSNINNNLEHHEQIYIIHERTFVELNANIYKIGKTKNIKNRLNGYSKGSKLLFSITCNNCTESENKILNYLKNTESKYRHAKEYGNEYFQCDLHDLISDI